MSDLTIANQNRLHDIAKTEEILKPLLEEFMQKLNKKPKSVKQNPYAQNAKYVPIEVVEALLDSIYSGNWQWEITSAKLEGNSYIVVGVLSVLNPITKTWLKRSGIGAVPIEISKDTGQVSSKAMHKNVPAASAFARRNAAQTLGESFGRNLNRSAEFGFIEDKTDNFEKMLRGDKNNHEIDYA